MVVGNDVCGERVVVSMKKMKLPSFIEREIYKTY